MALTAQFNCDLITIESISDTTSVNGAPAIKLILSTEENTHETGYTSFVILNSSNDTIVNYYAEPHYWMPSVPNQAIRTYILDMYPPFQSVGDNFEGQVFTYNPECIFQTDNLTHVETEAEALKITVFPNPFKDYIRLAFDEEKMEIQLYDVSGRLVFQNQVNKNKDIDLSHLNAGLYLLKVGGQQKLIVKK